MLNRLKNPSIINVQESSENLLSDEQKNKRQEIIERDKKHKDKIDLYTNELVKAMEGTKQFDEEYKKTGHSDQFKDLKYVEREEDLELKAMFDSEQDKFNKLSENMEGKVDGELDMDLHGNITFRPPGVQRGEPVAEEKETGITESGTYILRDGKLVKGKAEIREQA